MKFNELNKIKLKANQMKKKRKEKKRKQLAELRAGVFFDILNA